MPADSPPTAGPKPQARSRVSNGSAVLPGIDGRSAWARRYRDLLADHAVDLGAADEPLSEAKKALLRAAAALQIELERQDAAAAAGAEIDAAAYATAANTLRRLLVSLYGAELRRRPSADFWSGPLVFPRGRGA